MIAEYALKHGFTIVATYQDAGRSGLTLRQRSGLSRLLKDVVELPLFRTVLVYDVSRWGRFQDVDESAHYEFICKSAGVPICYCAELFTNDGSMSSLILKGLKRAMAAEFSRELGEKVKRGQVNLARLGYKMGGSASYGLRRLLIAADGTHKQGRPQELRQRPSGLQSWPRARGRDCPVDLSPCAGTRIPDQTNHSTPQ